MKVALLGYGKMGKEIEKILLERNHNVLLKVSSNNANFEKKLLNDVDVAIEFSTPNSAYQNILKCIETNTPVVVGTTGQWLNALDSIKTKISKNNSSLIYASNFSIGVNIFFKINETLAKIMTGFNDYETEIVEIHHTQKLDSPSGTAISLANQVILDNAKYVKWKENDDFNNENEINIVSKRIENVPGTHLITYENNIDKIEIKHEAKNRSGFALGAVIASEWIINKKGLFTMADVLKF